jgi:hypothetical protein
MWATTNKHEALVKLLLDHGASAQTKSATGRTVYDFAKSDSQKMAEILNPRDSMSSTSSLGLHTEYSSISSNAGDADRYYQYTTDENYEHFLSMDSERRPKLMDEYLFTDSENEGDGDNYNHDDDDDEDGADDSDEEDDEDKEVEFYWDKCMPDQMFVFGADDLSYILDTVISNLTLPVRNVQEIFLPANVVFLCARFAHYFSSEELAEDVMEGGLSRLGACVKVACFLLFLNISIH